MTRRPHRRLAAASLATVLALIASAVVATAASADPLPSPAPALPRTTDVVTSVPIPTIQLDSGYVWAQTTIGTTVYAGGSFSNAREAGKALGAGALTPRSNVLAYDITTGALLPFAPQVNGVIKSIAASPDGSRIYIGGSFNTVNGKSRSNVAALDAATGALIPGFGASIGGTGVYTLTATADTLYAGGLFTRASGAVRKNLAAFSTAGAVLPWAPTADLQVDASVMDPTREKLIVGGRFGIFNGAAQRGLAAVEPISGATVDWAAATVVQNGGEVQPKVARAGIFSLTTDGTGVYGTGWNFGGLAAGNLEGTFAAEPGTGLVRWLADCHGDHYGVYSTGKVVYTTSHAHTCETVGTFPDVWPKKNHYAEAYTVDARGLLTSPQIAGAWFKDWKGWASPSQYNWYPEFSPGSATGLGQAGLSITGTGGYLSIGGEFTAVNKKQFYGLVRFATPANGGKADAPRLGAGWTGIATSTSAGAVSITQTGNWDRDDLRLTYDLYREGVATPVATATLDSPFWKPPTVALTETGLPARSTQRYRLVARDADGTSATGEWMTVVVAG